MSVIRLIFTLVCLLAISACNENLNQVTEAETTATAEGEMVLQAPSRATAIPSIGVPPEIAAEVAETEASIAAAAAMAEAELNDEAIRKAYESQARLEEATDDN